MQADLPTFAANGVHGASVVTVVTAQDTHGVRRVHPIPVELVEAQLDAVVVDLVPQATKTGMLWSVEVIRSVEAAAAAHRLGELVVDPVLVDSSGRPLGDSAAVTAYRRLAALTTLFTPNRWEAELLIGRDLVDTDAVVAAAPELAALGPRVVVVTGGRSDGPTVADVIVAERDVEVVESPRVGLEPVRGTGCTFSAAAAALMAGGSEPLDAVVGARGFVAQQLRRTTELRPGGGRPGVPHCCDGGAAPSVDSE